ncbi:16897_t:CDS:2, partial [Racocetra persica]
MAEISNVKKGNKRSSPFQDTIIKMWVLLEGHPSPRKLKANLLQVSDLEDFKDILKEKIQVLKNIEPDDIVPNESNERILDFKIQIKGKKAFGDWTLKEVGSEIYKNTFISIDSMRKLSLEDFPELNLSFSDNEIAYFIKQLEDKAFAFNNKISTNEATVWEYISIFMTIAVKHIRKYIDSIAELNVEPELDGSRGYGNLNYEVVVQDVPVLINEAKNKTWKRELLKIWYKYILQLRKQKHEKVDSLPPMMFAKITPKIVCNCIGNNYQEAKNVVSYIARLLQVQSDILKNDNNQDKERDNKHYKF